MWGVQSDFIFYLRVLYYTQVAHCIKLMVFMFILNKYFIQTLRPYTMSLFLIRFVSLAQPWLSAVNGCRQNESQTADKNLSYTTQSISYTSLILSIYYQLMSCESNRLFRIWNVNRCFGLNEFITPPLPSSVTVVSSESGEKSARTKHCLQSSSALNNMMKDFDVTGQQEMDLFTGIMHLMY